MDAAAARMGGTKATVQYCLDGYHTRTVPIGSFDELVSVLRSIRLEASAVMDIIFSADVVVEGAGRISVGLDERCILTYTSEDFEETLTSLGNEAAQGAAWYYFGDHTLMANQYVIPYDEALNALEFWIQHGALSSRVRWTDKLF